MSQERRPYVEIPPDLRDTTSHAPAPPLQTLENRPDLEVRGLGKCFDLYPHDRDRVLEFLTRQTRHDRFWALKELTFEVPRGCAFGIIGSNGAGKSTLLKILSGVSRPTEGSLTVNASISSLLDLGLGFHTGFTGRQNIYLNCTLMGLDRARIDALLPQILDFAELESFIDYPVKTYSSGMSLRLGFAVASHLDYQIFLIDEVLTVGDQYFQRKCVRKIEQFIEQGRTIVLVSHDLHAVRSLCDRVLWLKDGRAVMEGPAAEVVDTYVDAVRAREGGAISRPPGLEAIRRLRTEEANLMRRAFISPTEPDASIPDPSSPAPSSPAPSSPVQPDGGPVALPASPGVIGQPSPVTDEHSRPPATPESAPAPAPALETAPAAPPEAPSTPPAIALESLRADLAEQFRQEWLHEGPHAGHSASPQTSSNSSSDPNSQQLPSAQASAQFPWRATLHDPALRETLTRAMRLPQARALWQSGEAPSPLMEYHGDMPLVTGSGEARVLEVLFLDRDGAARETFVTLEPLTFAVTFKAVVPVEDPIFGVAIHRNDDVYVYGPNTQFDRCLKGTYHGIYTFFLHYPSMPLLAGTYRISVALWDKHHLKPYAWHNRLYTLTFKADRDDHGIIVLPHDWAVMTHLAGDQEVLPPETDP